MSRVVVGYDADHRKLWSDSIPARARIPWTQAGSISGVFAMPVHPSGHVVDRSASAKKGWATKKLRGQGLEP